MSRFIELKSNNSKVRRDQIAKEIRCSSFTLQRYSNDKKMQSTFKSSGLKKLNGSQKIENIEPVSNEAYAVSTSDVRYPNELDIKKGKLKDDGNFEIDEKYLDEIFHYDNNIF